MTGLGSLAAGYFAFLEIAPKLGFEVCVKLEFGRSDSFFSGGLFSVRPGYIVGYCTLGDSRKPLLLDYKPISN